MKHAKRYNLPKDLPSLSKKKITEWVDIPTDEAFTALHFASFHGNLDLVIQLVEEYFSDILKKNLFGASALHIAAQGDQPAPLYYLVTVKGMDVNDGDDRGSTPVHWACFARSEFALSYLLAMKPDLE
jgi:ankyrin repeat protein